MTATRKQHSTKRTPAAFELGWNEWRLGFGTGPADNPRLRNIGARNAEALLQEIAKGKKRFGLPDDAPVHSCYEAGRDGFWLHRFWKNRGSTIRWSTRRASRGGIRCQFLREKRASMMTHLSSPRHIFSSWEGVARTWPPSRNWVNWGPWRRPRYRL